MRIGFIFTLVLILIVFIFVFKTLTINEICGWKGIGKNEWPCFCIGLKREAVDRDLLSVSDTTRKTYNCTGLNLSCSDFTLKYFYKGNQQKPVFCEKTVK